MKFTEAFEILQESLEMCMYLPKWDRVQGHNPACPTLIAIQIPDNTSKMTHPYLYVESRFEKVPWMPTVVELFSQDWEVSEV